MTLVIGITAKDGALLVSDCQLTRGIDKLAVEKIRPALYSPEHEGVENPQLTGIYYGTSGSHAFFDLGLLAQNVFARAPNVADLLTDEFILRNPLAQINESLDSLDEQSRTILPADGNGDAYWNARKNARREEEYMTQCRDVRSFIESGDFGAVSDLSRVVLRLSEHYQPNLVHIKDSHVEPVRYLAIGSGKQLVHEELSRRFSEDLTSQDALALAIDAMNIALRQRDQYVGYQLVIVTRFADGNNVLRTAKDLTSHQIDLQKLEYLDPRFRPLKS